MASRRAMASSGVCAVVASFSLVLAMAAAGLIGAAGWQESPQFCDAGWLEIATSSLQSCLVHGNELDICCDRLDMYIVDLSEGVCGVCNLRFFTGGWLAPRNCDTWCLAIANAAAVYKP